MTKRIALIDSIGCIFNIRLWMNECLAMSNHIRGDSLIKKEFEQLTAPRFIDNYVGSIHPTPSSDKAVLNGLLRQRSPAGIYLVEGAKQALETIVASGITPIVVIPAGYTYNKLRLQCISRGLQCLTQPYRHASRKYAEYVLSDEGNYAIEFIIDDSRLTATSLKDKGHPAILLNMPWNSGDCTAPRISSWSSITEILESESYGTTKSDTSV